MFPQVRMRRNRMRKWSRNLLAENALCVNDLIWPVFVIDGKNIITKIPSMPDVERYSIDILVKKVKEAYDLGINAVAIFPVTPEEKKSELAEESYNEDNLICRAIKEIKKYVPEIGIIGDVALDPYSSHGQDGLVVGGEVDNDATIEVLCRQALAQAKAGVDVLAPSDMMDGRVGVIREALDESGYHNVQIMSYAAKYASSFYGPFRDAVGSAGNLKSGKQSYQMDPANAIEAITEVELDIAEGADMVIVKPGMPYLDIIRRVNDEMDIPVIAYQVSGEYAMIKAAAANGWLDGQKAMSESLLAFKRAGARAIITYAAVEIAKRFK